MIAAPRKMRSQAPLVYSQSFIWQLPRVATASYAGRPSPQRPYRSQEFVCSVAEVQECREVAHSLRVSLVAVSDSASVDHTRVCGVRSGQVRFITRPKSRTMRAKRN